MARKVNHKLVNTEEGNVLVTTITDIPVNKKVAKRMEQLNELQDTMLKNIADVHKEVKVDTEMKQTSVNLAKLYASVTERVETGLTLKAILYKPDIATEVNDMIDKLKTRKETK